MRPTKLFELTARPTGQFNFQKTSEDPTLVVPNYMLQGAVVARPTAELREGPGAQFHLKGSMLRKGEPLIVFEQVGNWSKVYVLKTGESGWVHKQASAPSKLTTLVAIKAKSLPRVFARTDIENVQSFDLDHGEQVTIPKGSGLSLLRLLEDKVLVWSFPLSSPYWVNRQDIL